MTALVAKGEVRDLMHQREPKPVNPIESKCERDDRPARQVRRRAVDFCFWQLAYDYESNAMLVQQDRDLRYVFQSKRQRTDRRQRKKKFARRESCLHALFASDDLHPTYP